MQSSAVIFGAGRIGRGFLAEIFFRADMHITFVDQDAHLVDALNGARQYTIVKAFKSGCVSSAITGFDALNTAQTVAIVDKIACANIAAIAVHPAALPTVLDMFSRAIEMRQTPLNVLLCVNMVSPAHACRNMFNDSRVKFVDTVVMRMSPDAPQEWLAKDPLTVYNSGYPEMPYDARAFLGDAPRGGTLRASEDILAEELRKIYTLNMAHAALAYVGAPLGYAFAADAMGDTKLRSLVVDALNESATGLCGECGFRPLDMEQWNREIIDMVDNPRLMDDLSRLGNDPKRKLAPTDRLVGPARLCIKHGGAPKALARAICAGYRHPALSESLANKGLDALMREISDIVPGDGLYEWLKNEGDNL